MAKKDAKPVIVLDRTYNIPLRKEFLKVPKYKRSKKAVTALRKFLKRHMKSDNIRIGRFANEIIWQHGIRNPPHHVQVHAVKDDKGVVTAELVGKPLWDEPKAEAKGKRKPAPAKKDQKPTAEALEKTDASEKAETAQIGEEQPKEAVPEAKSSKKKAPKKEEPVAAEETVDAEVVEETLVESAAEEPVVQDLAAEEAPIQDDEAEPAETPKKKPAKKPKTAKQ
jgi:large subunit ribosomal protein L31e